MLVVLSVMLTLGLGQHKIKVDASKDASNDTTPDTPIQEFIQQKLLSGVATVDRIKIMATKNCHEDRSVEGHDSYHMELVAGNPDNRDTTTELVGRDHGYIAVLFSRGEAPEVACMLDYDKCLDLPQKFGMCHCKSESGSGLQAAHTIRIKLQFPLKVKYSKWRLSIIWEQMGDKYTFPKPEFPLVNITTWHDLPEVFAKSGKCDIPVCPPAKEGTVYMMHCNIEVPQDRLHSCFNGSRDERVLFWQTEGPPKPMVAAACAFSSCKALSALFRVYMAREGNMIKSTMVLGNIRKKFGRTLEKKWTCTTLPRCGHQHKTTCNKLVINTW